MVIDDIATALLAPLAMQYLHAISRRARYADVSASRRAAGAIISPWPMRRLALISGTRRDAIGYRTPAHAGHCGADLALA